jgi:hypothetical protein
MSELRAIGLVAHGLANKKVRGVKHVARED